MQDAWRAYLELAMGLTEAPRKKAQDAVRRMVGTGGTAAQLQALAEELVSTGAANREALTKLVRFEVDRALGAVGLATADEVAELTRRVHELERQLREAKGGPSTAGPSASDEPTGGPSGAPSGAAPGGAPGGPSPAGAGGADVPVPAPTKAVAKKAVAKKAVAKRAPSALAGTSGEGAVPPAPAAKKAAPRKRTTGGEQ
ncbi:phasin family protein [Micromonospora sp. CPCC 205556]|uniref:phasin family protein n=1 Tax=Micromonospora sp. CPCC 205556 TaxID=3122398 RepID=UPI002FF16A69